MTDENARDVDALHAVGAKLLNVRADVFNALGAAVTPVMFLAQYDSAGMLIKLDAAEKYPLETGKSRTLSISGASVSKETARVSAFVWDETMKPIALR
jgi:hypothetical protein